MDVIKCCANCKSGVTLFDYDNDGMFTFWCYRIFERLINLGMICNNWEGFND